MVNMHLAFLCGFQFRKATITWLCLTVNRNLVVHIREDNLVRNAVSFSILAAFFIIFVWTIRHTHQSDCFSSHHIKHSVLLKADKRVNWKLTQSQPSPCLKVHCVVAIACKGQQDTSSLESVATPFKAEIFHSMLEKRFEAEGSKCWRIFLKPTGID